MSSLRCPPFAVADARAFELERLRVTVSRRPVAELTPLGRPTWISGAALERVLRAAPADRGLLDDLAPLRGQTIELA